MPMDFPDLDSLKCAAMVHKFRDIKNGETEDEYREAVANHVSPIDFIESQEIRNGVGWDKWTDKQKMDMLIRKGMGT